MTAPTNPFADGAHLYYQAGWPGILPVVGKAGGLPSGFTGAHGKDADVEQLARWMAQRPADSIALRLPPGVVGIDVDHYDKVVTPVEGETRTVCKRGDDRLAELVERFGALPATWSSTSRGSDAGPGPSRILLFRAPPDRYVANLGADIEIIQHHHRYAVVWPSVHETGGVYQWYDPDGTPSAGPPRPNDLAELPDTWVEGIKIGATGEGPAPAGAAEGDELLGALVADVRTPCAQLANALAMAADQLDAADAGSRHDTMTARTYHLVVLAAHGHPGFGGVVDALRAMWDEATFGEDRATEFDRMLTTAARKAVTAVGGTAQLSGDPCLLSGVVGAVWTPRQAIGAEPFDPPAMHDQHLAAAVLTRMSPVMRWARDAGVWMLREPDRWETSNGPAADWAMGELAWLMPYGDPDADKGTPAKNQAERRARFLSGSASRPIAAKMRSLVTADRLKLADLDQDHEVLWAGGVPWSLAVSYDKPVAAQLDPNVPHMHTARYAPDRRPTPLWDAFTAAVWPDPEVRAWALRVLSVAFTGYSARALPILLGETGRGKTQVVTLLMDVLGTYAHVGDPRLLSNADNAHASIVYALKGRRLSFIDEGPPEGRWAQERVKMLTGGSELTGNAMRVDPITFRPTHTLVLTANDEPSLVDAALRARVRLLPCEGNADEIAATRRAIGPVEGVTWRNEAPGVLAAMMAEAAGYLADTTSADQLSAPEAIRYKGEDIAAEQNATKRWVDAETEDDDPGYPARELYQAFRRSCLASGIRPDQTPSETKWGRELTRLGYPPKHTRKGSVRGLKLGRGRGFYPQATLPPVDNYGPPVTGSSGIGDGSMTGSEGDPSQISPQVTGENGSIGDGVTGYTPGFHSPARTHTHTQEPNRETTRHSSPTPQEPPSDQAKRAVTIGDGDPSPADNPPRVTGRTPTGRVSTGKKAVVEANRIEAARQAGGPTVQLPAVVSRDLVQTLDLDTAAMVVHQAVRDAGALTIDVEHTGYPVGHRDHQLRTVQLGNDDYAVVLDADDPAQVDLAAMLITPEANRPRLHAHSATADLVPLHHAGIITDLDEAWSRMHDTAIGVKLHDPNADGDDLGLKATAAELLGTRSVSHAADEARAALFKAGKWLTNIKVTTPYARSGWAQADKTSTVMVRYAAADVIDAAGIAAERSLDDIPDTVVDRERTAQRMCARVSDVGLKIDGDHVTEMLDHHTTERAKIGETINAAGIDNPGSSKQVGTKLTELGVPLPVTKAGNTSVAAGVLERLDVARLDPDAAELVRTVLDWRHHDTVVTTFLTPYDHLVKYGDGRVRPTIHTLGTRTGRMSSVRPNLQQLSRVGGVRACIVADVGHLLISADFSGVELRTAAYLSGDEVLMALLDQGADIHGLIAAKVWGEGWTKEQRYKIKRLVFGHIYGGSIPTLAVQAGIDEVTAQAAVMELETLCPGLAAWADEVKARVRAGSNRFATYTGRVIHLPIPEPHKAPNYLIQGTARELLVDALVRFEATPWGRSVLVPVHDEVLAQVPEAEADAATAALVESMTLTLGGVDIVAEASSPATAWQDAA